MNKQFKDSGKNRLSSFFSSSVILSSIDRFTAYIYSLIAGGFFGFLFTGYRNTTVSAVADRVSSSKLAHHLGELRYGICRHIEESFFCNLVTRIAGYFLACRMKVYGTFLVSFGAYNVVFNVVRSLISGDAAALVRDKATIISLIIIFASIPFLVSKKNLHEALVSSVIGRFILKITGSTPSEVSPATSKLGHSSVAFLCGVVVALFTHSLNPLYVIVAAAAVVWAYLVLIRPELGVLTLFFTMPLFPTMLLAAVVIYTFLCWCIKLLRGKRVLRFEPIDIVVMAFALILLSGGVISLSSGSLKPALLMVCLILGYFLTVQLLGSREWLVRASTAAVVSSTLVSLYGIITYYTGSGYFSKAWLDDEMFEGISNRAVSTLENPNMLGEYLILLLPIAIVMLIGKGEGLRRIPAFFCIGIMGACLLLTWSRGAWLALIVALMCLLFMWHHRSIWLVIIGLASIPILPSVLPASIISRFSSIGNMADSSTSYRVYIWRGSVNMLRDNFIAGIGIGESAWRRMYPLYTYMGIEAAPHSHNLFIQIWLETGIFGIVAFLAFVFLLFKAAFTLFSTVSASTLRTPELTEKTMYLDDELGVGTIDAQASSKRQIRLSVIGSLSGIIAVLVQGMTDYSWYNYRLYLMFWLVAGLTVAYIRSGYSYISHTSENTNNIRKREGKQK